MAELITGRGGTDHVDSEDFGAFNAVTLGDGTYILSGCSMTMKTASTLHIAAGELLMQGRHVRIKGAGEDLDVAVGTTGYNRNDLVALHYKQEGGIESVSVEVVAGTPSTGAASDPELGGGSILNGDAEAYVAIARVPIVGLAPSEPVALVGGLKSNSQLAESISAIGDSVSQLSESKAVTLQSGITYEVSGNVVIVNAYNITYSGNLRRFGPMPKGLRPRSTRYGIVNSGSNAGIVFVDASGNIDVWAGANGTYTGQVVYAV